MPIIAEQGPLPAQLIVMSGLTILTIIISQLHKLVAIFDKKASQATELAVKNDKTNQAEDPTVKSKDKISVSKVFPSDIQETANIFENLIDELEKHFELSAFYKLAEKNNIPHPILTISRLREVGIMKHEDEGLFSWEKPALKIES